MAEGGQPGPACRQRQQPPPQIGPRHKMHMN